jgi:GT2 family glycosyltransferase
VILNWNGLEDTLSCLSSVFASQYGNFKVIVIDNNSINDELKIIRSKFPEIHGLQSKTNLGYTGGCNFGIKYALQRDADYVWLLNNDARVFPETLQSLIRKMQEDLFIGMISPIIYDDHFKEIITCGSSIQFETLTFKNLKTADEYLELEKSSPPKVTLWGTALMLRRAMIEQVGLYDDQYFAYGEDQDLSVRVLHHGWKNSVDVNSNICHGETTSKISKHKYYYMYRNRYLFLSQHSLPKYRKSNLANYISDTLLYVSVYKQREEIEIAKIYLDGMWNAGHKIFGDWENRNIMPSILSSILLWQPKVFYKLFRIITLMVNLMGGVHHRPHSTG